MNSEKFDVIVIGSGPGGYPAAIRAASLGKKVALIEKAEIGGTCLNRGCIPSKALISSARHYNSILRSADYGVEVGSVKLNYPKMVERAQEIVYKIRKSLESLIKANKIEIVRGEAKFSGPKTVVVDGRTLIADNIIIASGSEPRIVPVFPVDGKVIHDSTSLLLSKELPESLIVIGGGVIGCEFASMLNLLGVKVTIVEMLDRIVTTESKEISKELTKVFKKRGIDVKTGVKVDALKSQTTGVEVTLESGEKITSASALISVGRKVNVDRLNLDKTGLKLNEQGALSVNSQMETTVPGIYAIGDVLGRYWLAHVSTHQGVVAALNACGEDHQMEENAIPSVIFTDPEIASVGMNLEKAKERGFAATSGKFPFLALGKSHAIGETEGFAQVVIDEDTGQILGAEVIGAEASSLIAEMTLAIANELTVECLVETVHAHPTLPEAWHEAALVAINTPLHLPPKRR